VSRLTTTHDLGLVLFTSYGADARLTGDPAARRVLLTAARTLARRYSPVVGALKSYDLPSEPGAAPVIIDNLVNLDLLLWAAEHGGDPGLRDIALQHALTTVRDHVEPDGSTWQNVRYDQATGEILLRYDRGWARGQAWAVHGFTDVWAATRDVRVLAAARRVSAHLLDRLPADGVPHFHLGATDEPRDSSAGAIAAAGLLHLAVVDPDPALRARWRAGGERLLDALAAPGYAGDVATSRAAVLHGTYALFPRAVDMGLVWADHYRLQALLASRLLPPRGPRLPVRSATTAVTDARPATAWPARPGAAPLQLDLGAVRPVGALTLDWRGGPAVAFRVEASTDGAAWRRVHRGLSAGDAERPESYELGDVRARWLRVVPEAAPAGAGVRAASAWGPEPALAQDRVVALSSPGAAPLPHGLRTALVSRVVDASGAARAGDRVELWTRTPGTPDWVRRAVGTSGRDGRTSWPLVAERSAVLQVRAPATPTAGAALTAPVELRVGRAPLR